MRRMVYRVQDKDGLGPFKPGVSDLWRDDSKSDRVLDKLKNPLEEFGTSFLLAVMGERNVGCGCRSKDILHVWFNAKEIEKLKSLGYYEVEIEADRILFESPVQIIFATDKPLRSYRQPASNERHGA